MRGCVGKERIELLLALGANRMEATSETMQRCLVLALTPVLNQMSVMGIVSIPGMMTGQILGGTSPSQVPKSQMLHATHHVIEHYLQFVWLAICLHDVVSCISARLLGASKLSTRHGCACMSAIAAVLEFIAACL